ncbi:MAG: phosphoribosylformylglycinamidine synthase I [Flavobacteriales bacterium]|nr:phosphoribosylformylglycinamidine synthase I [Flavobacteriales bacterium]|tara:strand:+ start:1484 stop:2176 length:693 start_codon:yes stop_codon:yes gene_type:complete
MKFGVVVFPGSNCDHDVAYALKEKLGKNVVFLWHKEKSIKNCDFIILPGGFSYGDYLRSGAIAQFSPIMQSIEKHAKNGGYILGICNGFQILCESKLLPGTLLRNKNQKFICDNVFIKSANPNIFENKKIYKIPIAHAEGRFYCDELTLKNLINKKQILFKYCSKDGEVNADSNPNGALKNIAGICNEQQNVFGMMPHPERACDENLNNTDGKFILESILSFCKKKESEL